MRTSFLTFITARHTPPSPKPRRLFALFRKSKEGVTAIEFAIVAMPFFAMLFAIIETALVLFAGQLLENAVSDVSRLIMTGQVQTQGMSQDQFKAKVCERLGSIFKCGSGLQIDVHSFNDFSTANTNRPVDDSGQLNTAGFGFSPGGSGDIVVVRAVYEWPVFVTRLGMNLADQHNGKHLLVGTSMFKNEPYD